MLCLVVYIILCVVICFKLSKYPQRDILKLNCCNRGTPLQLESRNPRVNTRRNLNYKKGARKTVVFILVAFMTFVLILPSFVAIFWVFVTCNHIADGCTSFTELLADMWDLFLSLRMMNHCINPIVFGIADLQFRQKCILIYRQFCKTGT